MMKNRWLAAIIAMLVALSFVSTQIVLLNPVNGLWSTINDRFKAALRKARDLMGMVAESRTLRDIVPGSA